MKYVFQAADGIEIDQRINGLEWTLDTENDEWYMDSGHYSILVDGDFNSMSVVIGRQGKFVKKETGIRGHAGQTLLIEHILGTDKTMNQNSRDMLRQLIGSV